MTLRELRKTLDSKFDLERAEEDPGFGKPAVEVARDHSAETAHLLLG